MIIDEKFIRGLSLDARNEGRHFGVGGMTSYPPVCATALMSNNVKRDYFFFQAGHGTKDKIVDSKTYSKYNFPICVANGKLYH